MLGSHSLYTVQGSWENGFSYTFALFKLFKQARVQIKFNVSVSAMEESLHFNSGLQFFSAMTKDYFEFVFLFFFF